MDKHYDGGSGLPLRVPTLPTHAHVFGALVVDAVGEPFPHLPAFDTYEAAEQAAKHLWADGDEAYVQRLTLADA